MKFHRLLLVVLLAEGAFAQLPETDIFLSHIKTVGGKLEFSKPENITNRKGYDNQPFFLPDGSGLLYVAVEDTTQADIFRYEFKSGKAARITHSIESEYSPALTPDGKSISVVRVDTDNGQRMYSFPIQDAGNASRIPGTDSIGYYSWLSDSTLAMFILGDAMTLQILNRFSGERTLVASDIGRCMKMSRDKKTLYFVIKQNEMEWGIFEMNVTTFEKKKICNTLQGSEDFEVMKDGNLLMGKDGKLYACQHSGNEPWKELADFSAALGDFYRITLSPNGDRIAMVAFTGKKP